MVFIKWFSRLKSGEILLFGWMFFKNKSWKPCLKFIMQILFLENTLYVFAFLFVFLEQILKTTSKQDLLQIGQKSPLLFNFILLLYQWKCTQSTSPVIKSHNKTNKLEQNLSFKWATQLDIQEAYEHACSWIVVPEENQKSIQQEGSSQKIQSRWLSPKKVVSSFIGPI